MQSLRRYIDIRELAEYGITNADNYTLIQAEADIDNVLASFYQGSYTRCFLGYKIVKNVVLTNTTATLESNETQNNGYYKYTVLEILENGKRIAVENSTANVLTFFDTQTGISGTKDCKIYQFGKLPMTKDYQLVNNTIYKTIPAEIKEAIVLQYKFRKNNSSLFIGQNRVANSYSVAGASYSETYGSGDEAYLSPKDLIDPVVFQILDSLGLTTQALF